LAPERGLSRHEKNKQSLASKPQNAEKPHSKTEGSVAQGPFEALRMQNGHPGGFTTIPGETGKKS